MKLLYVLRYYPTLSETFVYREMSELVARGHAVRAVAIGRRSDGRLQDELPPVPVQYPPHGFRGTAVVFALARALGSRDGRWAWAWARENMREKDAARACWMAVYAAEVGVTRIHAHFAGEAAEWAKVASAILGVPYSVTVHASDLFCPRPGIHQVLRDADAVFTIAEHHRGILRDRYDVSAHVVPCGVEVDRYPRAEPGSEESLRIVSVARNVPKKGLPLLARAVARSGSAKLRLVSDAPELSGGRVETGALRPSAVPAELARAHVFALPCRVAADGDRDGIPVAMMEAMAAGLPVLTTSVSGIPELVDESVGWIVPPDDEDALVRAIDEIAANPRERARRGERGRQRLFDRGFTVDRQVDGLLDVWGRS